MASGTRDLTVVPNQEGNESSMVPLDPSIKASLQRSSSVASENYIATGGDLRAGMEPSLLVASSKNSEIIEEIIEAEDDPSPRMEPSLQTTSSMLEPAKDEQSSRTDLDTFPECKVNPIIKGLFGDIGASHYYSKEDLVKLYFEQKQKLKDGLQKVPHGFLEHETMTELQEKVQELFDRFEAIEFVISNWKRLLKTGIKERDQPIFEADYYRIDIYHRLFKHALSYANKLQEYPSVDLTHLDPLTATNWLEYFKAIDLMVFFLNKVQGDIVDPSLALQWAKTLVTKFVHRHEEETISTVICLVVNDEDEEAKILFRRLLKHMKPSDIINRGRIYNYALQKAQELLEVYKFLSNPSLSQRYKDVVQCYNRLERLAMEYDNQAKVQRFLVDLYLKDSWWNHPMEEEIDWEFVEEHDYLYLIQCVWKSCYQCMMLPYYKHDMMLPMHLDYVFTSSAAIAGGQDIMKRLLEVWPTLDVNASYKGVAALHVATFKGNEELFKFLFTQKEFDINVRTERRLVGDDVQRITNSGKKWNKNRWELPTYQTALHIATSQRQTKVVKLLCDAPKPHQQRLRCHEEDEEDRTPLDILYGGQCEARENFDFLVIEKTILSKRDVQNGINKLYRNRQVLVDAVNTILVGAALIASVTFVGWLQPPLGYAQYYDLVVPSPAPPNTYDSYLAVQGNLGVKAFSLFNSLSFFFAIATVIVGADAAFPQPTNKYIGQVVQAMQLLLRRAIKLLIISLVCVLGAFGSAAIVVLPPFLFFRKDMLLSIIIGGGVCSYVLWQLLSRHFTRMKRINDYIASIINLANVF